MNFVEERLEREEILESWKVEDQKAKHNLVVRMGTFWWVLLLWLRDLGRCCEAHELP